MVIFLCEAMLCDGLKAHVDRLKKLEEFPQDGGIPKSPKTHVAFFKEQKHQFQFQRAAKASSKELQLMVC